MNKNLIAVCMMGMVLAVSLFAQDDPLDQFKLIGKMGADKKSSPAPDATPNPSEQPPTTITASKGASFDQKLKMAVFNGNVYLKNPQFTLSSDKLTVFFNRNEIGAKKEPTPKPSPTAKGNASAPAPQQGGGIEKVIAEGNVVVTSDRPDPKGGPPVHYVGKGAKVIYNPATGEAVLSGWPQVQKDINTMAATDSSTVIYLNRDGTMRADGPVQMEVHDPGPDKQSPTPARSPEAK